ncbi:6-bladed beta-propeller [Gracilimonas sp.]|uniref:6-bladed beta-propeller n=1 Tax=Gracilimonas sp. TaxID=1974203 RepID=UPI0028728A79|nr:6-bladed beta-propeller [Gracilimonas sp.]
MKTVLFLFSFILLSGCEKTNDTSERYNFTFTKIGEINLQNSLLTGANRILRNETHIYILDTRLGKIFRYDSTGKNLGDFGGEGSGPGEFRKAVSFDFGSHNTLYVYDRDLQRISEFDLEGTFKRLIPVKALGTQLIATNTKFLLHNSTVFSHEKPMVKVIDMDSGEIVKEISPLSDLVADLGFGISGPALFGVTESESKIHVLQHPFHLKLFSYDKAGVIKKFEKELSSDFFVKPDFSNFNRYSDKVEERTNASIYAVFSSEEKIFFIYDEFHTPDRYMDIFDYDGNLLNKAPVKLGGAYPIHFFENIFYSLAYKDTVNIEQGFKLNTYTLEVSDSE